MNKMLYMSHSLKFQLFQTSEFANPNYILKAYFVPIAFAQKF